VLYLKINNKQPPFGVKNNMLGYLFADIFILFHEELCGKECEITEA